MSPDDLPEVLVLAEAAELMRVKPETLRTWADKGLVPCEWFGTWRFRKSRLLATMETPRANQAKDTAPARGAPDVRRIFEGKRAKTGKSGASRA